VQRGDRTFRQNRAWAEQISAQTKHRWQTGIALRPGNIELT